MIFSVGDHIQQIIAGTKTQTRRVAVVNGFIYQVGKTYSIQPCRTCKGISEGRILIKRRWLELRQDRISAEDALAEGGYRPQEYEDLFKEMRGNWTCRYAYTFKFVPTEAVKA